jgi:hypothetical protein
MGFCLFEDWEHRGYYFAVNTSHVKDYGLLKKDKLGDRCKIIFQNSPLYNGKLFEFVACGSEEQISLTLSQAARIGISKSNLNMLGNCLQSLSRF